VSSSHQRQHPRIRIQIPVFLRGTDALGVEFIELTKTLNISSTGACIASSHLLQTEQLIQLTIPTPSPSTAGLVPHETPPISARVLRQESAGDLRLFGLEFLHPLS
jgi:PilZ domain